MGRTYDFLRRKGYDNIYTEFWTPVFVGNVFDVNSYPKNRKNRIYEIRGMTIGEGVIENEYGTFTAKNGSIAIFNNASKLRDIVGSITIETIKELVRFDGYWTPESSTGTNTRWSFSDNEFNTYSELTIDDTIHTVTAPDVDPVFGVYVSNDVINESLPGIPNAPIYGVPFKIPTNLFNNDPDIIVEVGLVKYESAIPFTKEPYGVFFSGNAANQNLISVEIFGCYESVTNTSQLGIDFNNPSIDIDYSPNTIYVLAFNPNIGPHGTLNLYSNHPNNLTPNNPIITFSINSLNASNLTFTNPNSFYSELSAQNNKSGSVEIDNSRSFIPTGVTIVTGGIFDEDSIPIDAAGQAYTATDILVEPVYIPGYGNCFNGDMMFWNADGEMQGRPWGRKDIERDVTVNIGMNVTVHQLSQNDNDLPVDRTIDIVNYMVFMNSGLLVPTTDYTVSLNKRNITLLTPVVDPSGAEIVIVSFNY